LEIRPEDFQGRQSYMFATSLVVPRPIAWVSTLGPTGNKNLAPHSYFNVISSNPLIVHFTSTGVKDTLTNVRATKEFVVNVVSLDLVEEMNMTSADFPPGEDEFSWAGLDATPSSVVAPPRVSRAKAAFECEMVDELSMGNGNMVFGRVVNVYVDDDIYSDGHIDWTKLQPIARLGGPYYSATKEVFSIPRPTWADLSEDRKP
jgi:flavin reductase (DIM6/NTAB) family NADH-FMN oxidoreductase RutF